MGERKACPKCGDDSGWVRCVRVMGMVEEIGLWGDADNVESTSMDQCRYGQTPKTVRCLNCDHRTTPTEPKP